MIFTPVKINGFIIGLYVEQFELRGGIWWKIRSEMLGA